jgi:integrase
MFQEPIAPGVKELFGDCPLSRFDAKAVRILRDRRADRPEAANNRVRRLRRIFKWAVDSDIEGVTVNPARDVPLLRPVRAGGFPTWTVADIEKFEKRHPIGSKARLALALLSYTGVRRSDVVQLGKQHLRNGWLVFRQFKGRNLAPLTAEIPILRELQSVIDATNTGDLTFLVTERGQPFTASGFGNWFRDRCNEAALKGLSAHGMRKAAATRAAERGATAHQLMAIFGWRTIKQAEVYTRAAERKRLAGTAMHLLGTDGGQESLTFNQQQPLVREKEAKS